MVGPLQKHQPHAMFTKENAAIFQNTHNPLGKMRKTFQDAEFVIVLEENVKKDMRARENGKFKQD